MKPSKIIRTSIFGLMLTATHLTAGSPPGGAGFNAVDGISSKLTIAVGDQGRIVHFLEGKNARRMPSPTERDLYDVHVGSEDFAVTVGPGIVMLWNGIRWQPIVQNNELSRYSQVWASPDQGLVLYGASDGQSHQVCPWLPQTMQQPFCRAFPSPLLGACGYRNELHIILANGSIHRVSSALIGTDGGFEPVFSPQKSILLKAAWMPVQDCVAEFGLPEVFAISEDNAFLHFDGKHWEPAPNKRYQAAFNMAGNPVRIINAPGIFPESR
jgi:hypothetical protein